MTNLPSYKHMSMLGWGIILFFIYTIIGAFYPDTWWPINPCDVSTKVEISGEIKAGEPIEFWVTRYKHKALPGMFRRWIIDGKAIPVGDEVINTPIDKCWTSRMGLTDPIPVKLKGHKARLQWEGSWRIPIPFVKRVVTRVAISDEFLIK